MEKPKDSKPAPAKPKREVATKISISGDKVLLTVAQLKAIQTTKEIAAVVSAIGSIDGKKAAELVVNGIAALADSGDVKSTD